MVCCLESSNHQLNHPFCLTFLCLQVRAETLKFKEEGVFAVVKDVFLPWYNAYRCGALSCRCVGLGEEAQAGLAGGDDCPGTARPGAGAEWIGA